MNLEDVNTCQCNAEEAGVSVRGLVNFSLTLSGFIVMVQLVLGSKDDVDLKLNLRKFEMDLRKRKRGP